MDGKNKYTFLNDGGYADKVDSTFFPFTMPVRELVWGRVHSEELDLAYSIAIESGIRKESAKIYLIHKGVGIEFNAVRRIIHDQKKWPDNSLTYPENYVIEAENSGYRLTLQVYDHQVAVMSDFINDGKQYGAMAMKLLAIISKNPRGIKSMAKASIRLSNSGVDFSTHDLMVIDEYVRFKGMG